MYVLWCDAASLTTVKHARCICRQLVLWA